MHSFKTITIVGAGRLATQLALQLETAGHFIEAIYSQNLNNAERLASRLYDSVPVDVLDFTEAESEIFILAVPDDVIFKVAQEIVLPEGATVIHTSGAKDIALLDMHKHYGVLWPLQTFSTQKEISFSNIPLCLEWSSDVVKFQLVNLAASLDAKWHNLDTIQRRWLHLSAVFASNFSNHLLAIASDFCTWQDIDFSLLQPLMKETIGKAFQLGPYAAQTGPASRQDFATIDAHLALLQNHPDIKYIYQMLTESIIKNKA